MGLYTRRRSFTPHHIVSVLRPRAECASEVNMGLSCQLSRSPWTRAVSSHRTGKTRSRRATSLARVFERPIQILVRSMGIGTRPWDGCRSVPLTEPNSSETQDTARRFAPADYGLPNRFTDYCQETRRHTLHAGRGRDSQCPGTLNRCWAPQDLWEHASCLPVTQNAVRFQFPVDPGCALDSGWWRRNGMHGSAWGVTRIPWKHAGIPARLRPPTQIR